MLNVAIDANGLDSIGKVQTQQHGSGILMSFGWTGENKSGFVSRLSWGGNSYLLHFTLLILAEMLLKSTIL